MSDIKYVMFWGNETPRVKRPPAEGEMYLWTKEDGSQFVFFNGQWEVYTPTPAEPETDA